MTFLRKRETTNHRRGPFHHRAPSKMFYRAVRGMIPHKTKRGNIALKRLRVIDGCPAPFDKLKKVVSPAALRVVRLRPGRAFTKLSDLATKVGWKYEGIIKALEDKRKAKVSYFSLKLLKILPQLNMHEYHLQLRSLGLSYPNFESCIPSHPFLKSGNDDTFTQLALRPLGSLKKLCSNAFYNLIQPYFQNIDK